MPGMWVHLSTAPGPLMPKPTKATRTTFSLGVTKLRALCWPASRVGTSVTAFPFDANLASWAGICSGSYESAGIKKSSHLTPRIRQRKSARTEATVLTPKFLKISKNSPAVHGGVISYIWLKEEAEDTN